MYPVSPCISAFSFNVVDALVLIDCRYSKDAIIFESYSYFHTLGDLGVIAKYPISNRVTFLLYPSVVPGLALSMIISRLYLKALLIYSKWLLRETAAYRRDGLGLSIQVKISSQNCSKWLLYIKYMV